MSPRLRSQSWLFESAKHLVMCDTGQSDVAMLPRQGSEFPWTDPGDLQSLCETRRRGQGCGNAILLPSSQGRGRRAHAKQA